MKSIAYFTTLNYSIAAVWLVNGLFCKVFNLAPRHQEIVAQILNQDYASELTLAIGISECIMVIWIISGYKSKVNVWTQISIILTMNLIELLAVPDLLLWGKFNLLFAILFSELIYYTHFHLKSSKN